MSKPTTEERRAHPRYLAQLDLQGTPEDGGVVARMVASDISLGGLQCISTADFPEMTRLEVRLMVPLQQNGRSVREPIVLEAVVVRREELSSASGEPRYELALFFAKLENGDRDSLARFIEASRLHSASRTAL